MPDTTPNTFSRNSQRSIEPHVIKSSMFDMHKKKKKQMDTKQFEEYKEQFEYS